MNESIRLPWINLYKRYCGIFSPEDEDRCFRAFTGVAIEVAEAIYIKCCHEIHLSSRTVLLLVLNFLKTYDTQDNSCRRFGMTRKTYRKYLWGAIDYLDAVMTEISLENRFEDFIPTTGLFKDISIVVDGTECPIVKPSYSKVHRKAYSSGRKKDTSHGRYNLKYTVGVQISTGKILFIAGPEPSSMHDMKALLQESELIAIVLRDNPSEIILADSGYVGHSRILTPFTGSDLSVDEIAFNTVLSSVRQIVECSLGRLKFFGILGSKGHFRGGVKGQYKHKKIFNVCAQVTNISLDRNPLWKCVNFYLCSDF